MPGATSTASCAGVPSGAGWSSSSGWRWPTPPSSVAGSSAAPGPTIAGTAVHAVAHERLLAQALSRQASRRRGRFPLSPPSLTADLTLSRNGAFARQETEAVAGLELWAQEAGV